MYIRKQKSQKKSSWQNLTIKQIKKPHKSFHGMKSDELPAST